MALDFMIFMRGLDITWGIGRVLLKVSPVLGPLIVLIYGLLSLHSSSSHHILKRSELG